MTSRMDNLDLLSDDELRLRLMQYGFQNLPITSNTRKLLIKKLRNHMESEKGKLRRETSYATRYSSGEESDGGGGRERRGSGRRSTSTATTRMTMPPPPARPVSSSSSKRTSAISSSSSPINNNNNVNSYSSSSNNNHNKSLSPGSSRSSVYISPVIINDSEEEDYSGGLRITGRGFGTSTPSPSALFRRTFRSARRGGHRNYQQQEHTAAAL